MFTQVAPSSVKPVKLTESKSKPTPVSKLPSKNASQLGMKIKSLKSLKQKQPKSRSKKGAKSTASSNQKLTGLVEKNSLSIGSFTTSYCSKDGSNVSSAAGDK